MNRWILTAALLFTASPAIAQVRPNADWQQIETAHFRVVYEPGLDSLAFHAARRAEMEFNRLAERLIRAPKGQISIVVADNTDLTNGYATPFPSNRIVIYARPPVDDLALTATDWIDIVVTHELAHIFHLDQAGRVGRGLRSAFGRIPFLWPVFPLLDQPRWNIEGLATMVESQHTGEGRVNGSYHEMIVRTAALENRFDPIDRVSGETPIWPGGSRAYIYGSLFMDFIARKYGPKAHTALIKKTAGSILPPNWRLDGIARSATGKTYSELYEEWRAEVTANANAQANALRSAGLTSSETLTTAGRYALFPRISKDSRLLAYAEENGRQSVATRVVALQDGSADRVRRNGLGPVSWLPDNTYLTAQFEFANPYDIVSDLYLVRDGHAERLTHGERAEMPDASPDGKHVVYVQNDAGRNRLVLRDLAANTARPLTTTGTALFALPRFAPDGSRIAVERTRSGVGHDIVILGRDGEVQSSIDTPGIDSAPAWSPDGQWILFSSDRTGIPNLYAANTAGALRQVTNTLTGAFYPEVSPDGQWIYYSGYHADGFHIERMRYDPASWREPAAPMAADAQRRDTIVVAEAAYDTTVSPPKSYSALRSLLPTWWLPIIDADTSFGTFYGVTTAGADDVGRHAYFLGVSYDPKHGRAEGALNYTFAGLGNPLLTLDLLREYDPGYVIVTDTNDSSSVARSYEREDRIALTAVLTRDRWRNGAALFLGVEGVDFNRHIFGPARFRDPLDRMLGFLVGAGFGNTRRPAYAISAEDGVSASAQLRRRIELDPSELGDESYTEATGYAAAYKSIDAFGYAHHVIGVRANALRRSDIGPGPEDVGGATAYLPVRGYKSGERVGFAAWTASLEYRIPLALIGRGYKVRPFFLDRTSLALFADAGNASCKEEQKLVYTICPGARPDRDTRMLSSAGVELNAVLSVFTFLPMWVRGGVAFPLEGGKPKGYFAFGPSF